MRYVMVPVPTEFVLDVMRMVVFRAPDDEDEGSAIRDEARIVRLVEEADPDTRGLLLLVARTTAVGDQLRLTDAAEALEMSGDALNELMRKVNALALGPSRDLIGVSEEIAIRVHGNVGKNRYLVMRPEHAAVIRRVAGPDLEAAG